MSSKKRQSAQITCISCIVHQHAFSKLLSLAPGVIEVQTCTTINIEYWWLAVCLTILAKQPGVRLLCGDL